LTPIPNVYFPSNTAFNALAAIQAVVIIPAWCIATAKLLGNLLPALRKLLQRRQVYRQCLLTNAFEQGNQLAAPLSGFDVSVGASCRKAGCQSLNPSVSNLL
jgi:hypothetical protein